MYGIFTYIYSKNVPNVGKYAIHGAYGIVVMYYLPEAKSPEKSSVPTRRLVAQRSGWAKAPRDEWSHVSVAETYGLAPLVGVFMVINSDI